MTDTKTSVVIKYSKPGTAPPIYLAGSFPQSVWQPQEMEYTNDSKDHYVFSKAVEVEEGKEYQYKFRIGEGDWWMSDDDAPIVTDEIGNRNNLLTVPIKSSPQTTSISNERSLEDNSTPRTLPDLDTKEIVVDEPNEPAQHTESGDKLLESSHPEVSPLATGSTSTSNHGTEVNAEKKEEAHDILPLVPEAVRTLEPEKEIPAKIIDASSMPTEQLELSSNGIDEPEYVESLVQPKVADESKTETTEAPDLKPTLATQEISEIAKESPNSEAKMVEPEGVTTEDADKILHAEAGTEKDEAVEQQEPVPIALEKLDSAKELLTSEVGANEDTGTKKDDVLEHKEPIYTAVEEPKSNQDPDANETNEELVPFATDEPKLKQESQSSEGESKEETCADKAEALECQEDSFPIVIEEPKSKEEPHASEIDKETVPVPVPAEEPNSKQELKVGESETKEEPIPTHIEESKSVQEPLASEDEAKEETDLGDSRSTVEEKQVEEVETSKSPNSEISTSNPILIDDSTENLTEELEQEVPQSSEIITSNPVLSNESVVEELSSPEKVNEAHATPKQECTVSEPIETTALPNVNETQEGDSFDVNEISTIEIPADETIEVPESNHEINSPGNESLDEKEVGQTAVDEPAESTTNTTKGDEQPSIPIEMVSVPILTLEKVDSEPRHGDDFGSGATFAQKDAHALHAQDALPDQIIIRQEAATPEFANVAADVADSAALLDEAPPTPPMSDEEAGMIGYRRLSHTPIPEVAETAADVADTAAQIDKNFKPTIIELPTPHRDFLSLSPGIDDLERDLDIETPSEERAPLFAHECNGPLTAEEQLEYERPQSQSTVPEPMFREFDPNDPSLEPFPSNFNQILEHVRRLENQLSEDETDVEGNPLSPVAMNGNHHAEGAEIPKSSAESVGHEISPSLLPIVEENVEGESESKLTALLPSMNKSQSDGTISDESKKDLEQKTGTNDAEISERASRDSLSQLPAMKLPQNSNKLHPVLPALPQTPFVENKSLNLNLTGSAQTSPAEQDKNSPTITVQPATPTASLNANVNDDVLQENVAKTTSFAEENGDSQLRARKQPASNAPERSITPSSMRSAGNDAKSRNFLRAFFQVVFVDWIGGLIRKLCGGGRHTLLAVPALLIVITPPILYLSGLVNFGFGLSS